MIELQRIHRSFGHRKILHDINMAVGREVVAITGPNGAGKSTLLQVAATVLRPTEGKVVVQGLDAAKNGPEARRCIGWAGQTQHLYPDLSAAEHMKFWTGMHQCDGGHDALVDAGLQSAMQKPARVLSGGQRQRLQLAMAFVHRPSVLLLDEPFSNLDADGQAWLTDRIRNHPGSVLTALHDQRHVDDVADRTVRLESGRVVA